MFLNRFKLKREALQFDSPLYLIKSFLGIMTCYVLFSHHSIVGKDMISVLFGMMLSLEPVNISGIKSGMAQFQATVLGGVVTAIIIMIAGVNWITVPIAVMVTLYISILLDWRNISPVAFFTAIYMTQYIQFSAAGEPSMLLTLRLRLLALGAGVIVAVCYNFIFSVLFYRSMAKKRTLYLLEKQSAFIATLVAITKSRESKELWQLKESITALFGDIDFIYDHIGALNQEKWRKMDLTNYVKLIMDSRRLNHYLYDLMLFLEDHPDIMVSSEQFLLEIEHLSREITFISRLESPLAHRGERGMSLVEWRYTVKIKNTLKNMFNYAEKL